MWSCIYLSVCLSDIDTEAAKSIAKTAIFLVGDLSMLGFAVEEDEGRPPPTLAALLTQRGTYTHIPFLCGVTEEKIYPTENRSTPQKIRLRLFSGFVRRIQIEFSCFLVFPKINI